ncbi:MAG TPA: ferritin-like domain-containing protein [Methylophilaceae bacterium]|jgi:uncharacterized ferritin-like protein (DUF455 family)
MTQPELRALALRWLAEPDPAKKAQGVAELTRNWESNQLTLDAGLSISPNAAIPGQPTKPELVSPLQVKRRAMNTVEGRAVLIHALAHIEFNAINLALDVIWRFAEMPITFYTDWLKVANEEALHFSLLSAHLNTFGYTYGDFPAHNSLWEMAAKTENDLLARIALVPRTMEARGLDATPAIRAKLAQAGDIQGAEILDIILRDEIGHVAIGNHWFAYLCNQRKLDTIDTYANLAQQYAAPTLRGPFNIEARRAAGFTELELAALPK